MTRRLALPFAIAVASALSLRLGTARADGVDPVCEDAYVTGQKLYKLQHRLLQSREKLLLCAKACPDELRASCGRWLQEIEHEISTLVVKAKDGAGHDVLDAQVDVDGAPVAGYADGTPIEVNPGEHIVRVSRANKEPLEQRVLVHAGEKLRVVEIWLEPPPPPVSYVTVRRRPIPVATYVLLGVGAAALASFAVFGTWTTVEYSNTNSCSPSCPPENRDPAFSVKTLVADVSLGVAGASDHKRGNVFRASR